ncbi:pentatricopeptide repeat-containing protein At3g29290 [Cornus florida]|uniref:pentatricopeptide repeat-containing protein At3g29290 n=1 Tax=Cornus florida TaxID=4283 RepID=UPI0028A1C118|nr:pentatricopeptide repeat-containing protein At3g29290 [Cornus florida]
MVDVLSNSLTVGPKSYGYNCQNRSNGPRSHEYRTHYHYVLCCNYISSDIKTNRRCARIYGLNMVSMSEETQTWIGVAQPRIQRMDSVFGSTRHEVSSVEFGSVCEEVNALFQEEEGEFTANGLENKLPAWGNVAIQPDSGSKNGGIDQPSVVEFTAIGLEKKLPVWGNVEMQPDSGSKTGGIDQPSVVSKGMVTVNENRVHFLEERNEEILSKRILGLSRTNKVRSALELFRSMEYSGLRPNLHAFNSLLSCLLRNEMLDDALRIFEFMKAGGYATGHTYSLVLKAIADSQGYDAAIHMFEELEGKSKDFDAVVYNTIISVCGKMNNWVQTRRIWESMKENDHVGTTVTYRLLVCIFVRCGQNELALDAYNEMLRNGLKPGNDEMQAIIGACAKEGKCDLGLSVFQEMRDSGLKPNLIACNALINSLGKAGKVKLAFKVYGHMKSLGHAPDAYTWNALLGALHRTNRHTDALRLFESIRKEQSSQLNIHLYNTILMSCQRLGLWDRALQLLWQMEASELPVSTASYNLVIGACEVARKPKVALQVYEHMVHRNCAPDTFTLLSLIRGCIWGSLWDEVEEMLNWVAPDSSLYNTAIQGMCLRGKIDSAKKLYTEMPKKGLKPDGKTRAFMLQSLSGNSVRQRKR